MGAWGSGVFENDSALDWLDEVIESNSLDKILQPLKRVINSRSRTILGIFHTKNNYLEEPLGSEALAASEIIAALLKCPGSNISEELNDWVEKSSLKVNINTAALAAEAVKIVKADSELKELWEESDSYSEWLDVVNDLEKRLLGM
ncbi:MAG: DUF4259 domain-containing protein [Chitinophagales bacterium]